MSITFITIDDEETETESEGEDRPRRRLIRNKIYELSDSISRKEPLERALKLLTERTDIRHDECNHDYHQACVCLICDRIIKGTDEVKFVRKSTILKNEHVLSIDYFNKSTNMAISPALQQQYQINDTDLQHLFLSPHSRRINDRYICCNSFKIFILDSNPFIILLTISAVTIPSSPVLGLGSKIMNLKGSKVSYININNKILINQSKHTFVGIVCRLWLQFYSKLQ